MVSEFGWRDGGGADPLMLWTYSSRGCWCAVWPDRGQYIAWAMHRDRTEKSVHPSEAAGMVWCESQMEAG